MLPRLNRPITIGCHMCMWNGHHNCDNIYIASHHAPGRRGALYKKSLLPRAHCNDLSQEALFGVWACSPSEFQTFSDTILESLHKNTLRISRQIMLFVIILLTSLSLSYARILPYQGLSQLAQTWTARSPVQQAMGQIPTQKACRVNSPFPHPGA